MLLLMYITSMSQRCQWQVLPSNFYVYLFHELFVIVNAVVHNEASACCDSTGGQSLLRKIPGILQGEEYFVLSNILPGLRSRVCHLICK